MTWGYALGWPSVYLAADEDPLLARLKFLKRFGLKTTMVGLQTWADLKPDHRDRLSAFLHEHGLAFTLGIHLQWSAPPDELKKLTDQTVEQLEKYGPAARTPICTTAGEGHHRFQNDPPLAAQLEAMSRGLPPLAEACEALKMPLAIENHADYWVTDLVQLCHAAPGLGIFFDVGNCCVVGEKPLAAGREASPYLLGGHFKDQHVAPNPKGSPICFEVRNANPGQGNLPMREIYAAMLKDCPDRERLTLQIEMFPDPWDEEPAIAQLEEALAFIRSLEPGDA